MTSLSALAKANLAPSRVHPEQNWLQEEPDLSPLVSYVTGTISSMDPSSSARQAARLYLALVQGFELAGVMKVTHAPKLWIDVGGDSFEIDLAEESDSSSSLASWNARSNGSGAVVTTVEPRPRIDRVTQFMETLAARLRATGPSPALSTSGSVTITPNTRIGRDALGEVPQDPIKRLASSLRQLDQLESRANAVSIRTNKLYWDIGRAYCDLFQTNPATGWPSKAPGDRTKVLATLAEQEGIDYRSSQRKAAWEKRLERAQKISILVGLFGPRILEFAPEVSVTRLEGEGIRALREARDGGLAVAEVAAIRQELRRCHSD